MGGPALLNKPGECASQVTNCCAAWEAICVERTKCLPSSTAVDAHVLHTVWALVSLARGLQSTVPTLVPL